MRRPTPVQLSALGAGLVVLWAMHYAAFAPRVRVPRLEASPATGPASQAAFDEDSPAGLDRSAFGVALWVEPPPPPPAPAEPIAARPRPPAPPPPLDLIAITGGAEAWHAIVYHRTGDRLVTLAPGDRLGPYRVASVEATTLRLDHDGRAVRLGLEQPRIAGREAGDE